MSDLKSHRGQLLQTLRRLYPVGSWRRLGDLLDAAGAPRVIAGDDAHPDHLALGLVIEGYVEVLGPRGEPGPVHGPGEVFGFPGRVFDPQGEGELVRVRGRRDEVARYLRIPDKVLHAFHRAAPRSFPEQLPRLP